MVGAVLTDIGSLLVAFGILIYSLNIHPFVERAAMIEHTVQNDLHSPLVSFLCKLGKKCIRCRQILRIRYPLYESGCFAVVSIFLL